MTPNPKDYNYNNVEQLKELIGQRINIMGRQDNHGSRRSGLVQLNNYICEDVKIHYCKRTHSDNSEFISVCFCLRKSEDSKRRTFVSWFFEK